MRPYRATYPSKKLPNPGGDFTVRQFILPIEIRNTVLWGWLDTGANISILPKEIAERSLGMNIGTKADGGYNLAGMVRVPYQTHKMDVNIFDYIEDSIKELNDEVYSSEGEIAFSLTQVEFQVPTLTWPEIADRLTATEPMFIVDEPMPWVILGSKGVLELLNLTMSGNNALRVSSYNISR